MSGIFFLDIPLFALNTTASRRYFHYNNKQPYIWSNHFLLFIFFDEN